MSTSKTVVSLVIPFTFVSEGKYTVSLNQMIANIDITYVQSNEVIDRIKGIQSLGKSELIPHDPEGIINISKVVLEFPFRYNTTEHTDNNDSNRSGVIKELCVSYLNRLRDVIRICTMKYWIRSISPQHLIIYDIETYDETGKGRKLLILFEPPSTPFFPVVTKDEKEVKNQISEMLVNEKEISLAETLYLDSLNLFHFFSLKEAIIIANVALEVFVWSHWLQKYLADGKSIDEADVLVSNLFDNGLQKAIKKKYFISLDEESRNKNEIWNKLQNVRNIRKNVIHPHTKKPSLEETRNVLLDVQFITNWISQQP